jgi:ACR3 family arsenite efflux pump ArsB
MHKIPRLLQKYMVLSIPGVMLLGFIAGLLADMHFLKVLILPLTFLMVYPSMVSLNFKQVFATGDSNLQVATQTFNFVLVPAIAYGLGQFFFPNDPLLQLGLFMTGLLPTSGMTITWTQMAKGNLAAAVKMTVIGLMAGSLLTPVYMEIVFGQSIKIPLSKTLIQIIIIIFIPMLLGYLTQKILTQKFGLKVFNEIQKPMIAPYSTLGVLGIQFVAMALKAPDLLRSPSLLVTLGLPILVFYVINFTLSTGLARVFKNRGDGIAFIYGTALRNLSIALAIAMAVFGPEAADVALLISLGFIFQAQMAAWHVKWIHKLLPE